jgi:hypothetical protein
MSEEPRDDAGSEQPRDDAGNSNRTVETKEASKRSLMQ